MEGPSWLGVGAQRSGTTWFGDILLQHPSVAFARDGRKEVHFFDRFLVEPWSDAEGARYQVLFDPARRAGDFTPSYLRCLWVPELVRRVCRKDVVILVMLRDPVERFASAMRWYATRPNVPLPERRNEHLNWVRDKGNDAIWGGMYATQLAAWARVFPRSQIHVVQYEAAVAAPQEAAERMWGKLGLASVPVKDAGKQSWNVTADSTPMPWTTVPGYREQLHALYEPEVAELARTWGIDRTLWPSFSAPAPHADSLPPPPA